MTTSNLSLDNPPSTSVGPLRDFPPWWQRWEAALERLGEQLNPILIKEARQALKSKQFLITFSLLLVCGWGWSLLGVALLSPGVYYVPGGRFMLIGYLLVLIAPMLLIVPFSAFRSLAAEREDGTFELVSITSLHARQIVTGKLGSAALQMLVYYSALAPCIAFTYLLRGVDIVTIGLLLAYTFLLAVLLSTVALVVATATQARHWQTVLAVLLLIGLLLATIIWSISAINMLWEGLGNSYRERSFWISHAALLSFYGSFLALGIYAAAAQLSFASDNRSTRLRVILMVQQLLWIGWITFGWCAAGDSGILFFMAAAAAVYWFVMGGLLSGESAPLSPRVKRSLPQSFLGRMFLTWFNPGSGTGYIFALTNLLTVLVVVAVLGLAAQAVGFRGAPANSNWLLFAALCGAYVTAYLGAGRLFLLLLRRWLRPGPFLALVLQLLLVFLGAAVPALLQAWLLGYRNLEYSPLQVTNWCWTLFLSARGPLDFEGLVVVLVFTAAGLLFVFNLLLAAAEVEAVRQQTPQRVQEEAGEDGQLQAPPPMLAAITTLRGGREP